MWEVCQLGQVDMLLKRKKCKFHFLCYCWNKNSTGRLQQLSIIRSENKTHHPFLRVNYSFNPDLCWVIEMFFTKSLWNTSHRARHVFQKSHNTKKWPLQEFMEMREHKQVDSDISISSGLWATICRFSNVAQESCLLIPGGYFLQL